MNPQLQLQLMMLGFWLFLMYKFYKPFFQSLKSVNWPIVKAIIVTSSFDRNGNSYSPKLIYRYKICNIEYQNDTYTFLGKSPISKSGAIEVSRNCPEGSLVDIHVDPNDPQNSVIVAGVHWSNILSFIALTVFCLCVAFMGQILDFIYPGCEPNCS